MFEALYELICDHLRFYQKYAVDSWNHIGPAGYLTLLTLVGVIGFISMLRSTKRLG